MSAPAAKTVTRTPFKKWCDENVGLLFLIPWIIGFVVFKLYPFATSLFYSFTDMNFFDGITKYGLMNYIYIFTNKKTLTSFIITFRYALITVPLKLIFALFIAYILNFKIKCVNLFRTMNIKKYMRDPKTGLYYHGYDESRQMYWADPVTGCSANFWLRAMGWFLVAMVDVLERMDEQMYYEYRAIMAMFKEAVEAMIQFQDAETGMFWQVIDKAGVPGNYLETSGSSLFAYAVLKGVRLGYLPKRFRAYGEKAFYGTCDKYLGVNDKGELQLSGICLVAGLGGATRRDGSLEYYFSEPVVENDAKGVAPLLLAYTEMIIQ